jgi:curved DNA-binding protein CbpA
VLGLHRGATRQEIKRAHRRLVKAHHPDRGGDGDDFRRIQAAYQLLIA